MTVKSDGHQVHCGCADQLRAEVERLQKGWDAELQRLAEMAKIVLKVTEERESLRLQVDAWRPVIDAAKAVCQKERWPYLNLGPLAHALDALHKTNHACGKCGEPSQGEDVCEKCEKAEAI